MKKPVKILLGVVGLCLSLMLVTGLAGKLLFSGSGVQTLVASLQSQLGAPVSAGGGSFDLAEWFRFRPSVALQQVSIGNPPGFSKQPLLTAQEVSAQVGLFSLFSSRPEVHSFTLRAPNLRIEQDSKGRSNLEVLTASLGSKGGGGTKSEGGGVTVDSLTIRGGTVHYAAITLNDVNISLADFASDKSCKMSVAARLFGGQASKVEFNGRAGPSKPESLPADGKLVVQLAPAEMPAALRDQFFGDMLRAPDASARADFESTLQGDLMGTLRGKGKFTAKDFSLGQDKSNRLPLRGEAPLDLTARRLLTAPSFDLRITDANLKLGDGRWTGKADIHFDGTRVQGDSSGAVKGVEVGQMLAAFTDAKGKASGIAEIPEYHLKFAGRNAAEIRNSLNGQGVVTLDKGKFSAFDLLGSIERHVNKMLTGETAAAGETDFTKFRTGFQVAGGKFQLSNLALENAKSKTTGQGYLTFEQEMSLDLETMVTGQLATLLGGKANSAGQIQAMVPVKVRGTVPAPKVFPDLGRMVKGRATEAATGLLDRLLQPKKAAESK
jgi:uncharacterized protein involved in outer membrane biogenesis